MCAAHRKSAVRTLATGLRAVCGLELVLCCARRGALLLRRRVWIELVDRDAVLRLVVFEVAEVVPQGLRVVRGHGGGYGKNRDG